MTTITDATEGQAKIREALERMLHVGGKLKTSLEKVYEFNTKADRSGAEFNRKEWDALEYVAHEALAALDASPPIVGEPDEAEVERIGKLISADHEFYRDAIGVTNILDIVRTTMRLAQAPQSSPATVARVYTERSAGKWHAGLNIGNQSFTLHANEGTEEEANWFAEMLSKALAQSSPSVIEAGDAMLSRLQHSSPKCLGGEKCVCGLAEIYERWDAAKASRPSVTAPKHLNLEDEALVWYTDPRNITSNPCDDLVAFARHVLSLSPADQGVTVDQDKCVHCGRLRSTPDEPNR